MLAEDQPDKRATHALVFEHVRGLELENLEVEWDRAKPEAEWESALVVRDVEGLTLDGFKGEPGRSGLLGVVRERVR
jgi:hypothetical protein